MSTSLHFCRPRSARACGRQWFLAWPCQPAAFGDTGALQATAPSDEKSPHVAGLVVRFCAISVFGSDQPWVARNSTTCSTLVIEPARVPSV